MPDGATRLRVAPGLDDDGDLVQIAQRWHARVGQPDQQRLDDLADSRKAEKPDELVEASRIDGASPLRFFKDVLLPLSRTSIAALFVIQFIYGWNQYLWPLLVTTDESMYPVVIGIKRMISGGDAANDWNLIMATALLAMLPPALVVILMQRWFVKGLVESEK